MFTDNDRLRRNCEAAEHSPSNVFRILEKSGKMT